MIVYAISCRAIRFNVPDPAVGPVGQLLRTIAFDSGGVGPQQVAGAVARAGLAVGRGGIPEMEGRLAKVAQVRQSKIITVGVAISRFPRAVRT